MKIVYSKYMNGLSIDDIVYYLVYFTKYDTIRNRDVEEIIDKMNEIL